MATKELRVTTGPQWKRFTFYSIYSWGEPFYHAKLDIVYLAIIHIWFVLNILVCIVKSLF